ncbi:hypothetical protein GCM10009127_17610 [Alteraurantiacibacter aestuarii]
MSIGPGLLRRRRTCADRKGKRGGDHGECECGFHGNSLHLWDSEETTIAGKCDERIVSGQSGRRNRTGMDLPWDRKVEEDEGWQWIDPDKERDE